MIGLVIYQKPFSAFRRKYCWVMGFVEICRHLSKLFTIDYLDSSLLYGNFTIF